ncbi:MAG: CPBP family intramembrane metalloprotease [Pseudobutyrivibrio sp.]|nr:CPBP family intramembrane metalloprotease [Pseudobutyrivibrio sp.]
MNEKKITTILFAVWVMAVLMIILTVGQTIMMMPEIPGIYHEGMTPAEITEALMNVDGLMANAQFLGEILAIIVLGIWYYKGYVKKDKEAGTYVSVVKKFENKFNILFVLCLIIFGSTLAYIVYTLTDMVIPSTVDAVDEMLGSIAGNTLGILAVCIGAPFSEELALRGIVMQKTKKAFGLVGCVLISGIAFGIIHANPVQFLYALSLGAAFGYIAYKFNSVIPSIIGHALHNTFGGAIFLYIGIPGEIVLLVLACVGIFFLYKKVTFPESKLTLEVSD